MLASGTYRVYIAQHGDPQPSKFSGYLVVASNSATGRNDYYLDTSGDGVQWPLTSMNGHEFWFERCDDLNAVGSNVAGASRSVTGTAPTEVDWDPWRLERDGVWIGGAIARQSGSTTFQLRVALDNSVASPVEVAQSSTLHIRPDFNGQTSPVTNADLDAFMSNHPNASTNHDSDLDCRS